ncbi:hypothetical protein TM5383_03139 [Thalassovita mediterranea]|jgi:hypothetical protein|uniref:Uncharacterized protein n=1 Tax=Thalassovita mediterranea TaxID=340021 RepID=A0A0P1GST7_9RHOB|nr:hypothetical protein TM5383_03139 [Thalassovita mediterranea]SIS32757.1 hypothetical protein SAMN05421685_10790 [Thalassovita mediterranea]
MRFITLVLGTAVTITAFSMMSTYAATPDRVLPAAVIN